MGSNRTVGGIPRYIDQQVEHLSDNVTTRVYDTETPSGSGPLWVVLAVFQTMFTALRFPFRRRPDIVHVHTAHWFSFYRATFYILFSRYIWRVPVVVHIHGSSFDEFLTANSIVAQTIQRIGFHACSSVITLSDYWRELVETHTNADRVIAIQNAVDPEKYADSSDTKDQTIVYVSHLSERKGAAEFATAISALVDQQDGLTVHVAGSGQYADRIEQLEDEYNEVNYHGYVSEEKKRDLLADGTIFVLPSYAEGLPIAILEAMAAGNAIVSTSVGSIPEVITEDRGRVIEPGDPSALRTALQSLCRSNSEVSRMAVRNQEIVQTKYNWECIASELYDTYSELLSRDIESER
ncbi:glycosyltransferase family 4 protein [Halopiger djelfimassiliensis]|uniref:glycosyltransferase family 4 protein n=1 Tax=Halopiger djelfimassiliensis TaxID=1293047 RepID=UPI0022830BE3|nr:glycosyltransferase family 4 protein [Halopiger djelfimassiliensis]